VLTNSVLHGAGQRYFSCAANRGLLVELPSCDLLQIPESGASDLLQISELGAPVGREHAPSGGRRAATADSHVELMTMMQRAQANFARFHGRRAESVAAVEVESSSAGVRGWAAAELDGSGVPRTVSGVPPEGLPAPRQQGGWRTAVEIRSTAGAARGGGGVTPYCPICNRGLVRVERVGELPRCDNPDCVSNADDDGGS
jgi:hypothetical protein